MTCRISKKQERIDAARIQRAVTGLLIPMLLIPRLYRHAAALIASGADDAALRAGIVAFLGDAK
jgi:hypothetical protein